MFVLPCEACNKGICLHFSRASEFHSIPIDCDLQTTLTSHHSSVGSSSTNSPLNPRAERTAQPQHYRTMIAEHAKNDIRVCSARMARIKVKEKGKGGRQYCIEEQILVRWLFTRQSWRTCSQREKIRGSSGFPSVRRSKCRTMKELVKLAYDVRFVLLPYDSNKYLIVSLVLLITELNWTQALG